MVKIVKHADPAPLEVHGTISATLPLKVEVAASATVEPALTLAERLADTQAKSLRLAGLRAEHAQLVSTLADREKCESTFAARATLSGNAYQGDTSLIRDRARLSTLNQLIPDAERILAENTDELRRAFAASIPSVEEKLRLRFESLDDEGTRLVKKGMSMRSEAAKTLGAAHADFVATAEMLLGKDCFTLGGASDLFARFKDSF